MRKAKIITLEEFKKKMKPLIENIPSFPKVIEKDISKVQFDWENYEFQKGGCEIDYRILSNGLPVLWIWAGGDWEIPVNFIIYWNGKELRGYIPSDGYNYNKKTKAAYGNEYDFGEEEIDQDDIERDYEAMKKDIINRIQIIQ